MKAIFTAMMLVTTVSAGARAQQQDFSQVQIKTTKIGGNFYMLEGSGGAIGVLPGPDGVFNNVVLPTSATGDPVLMTTVGTLTYRCTLHSGEGGSIQIQQ